MKKFIWLFFSVSLLVLTSCRVLFTDSERIKLERGGVNLKKIQYYNSESLEITRRLTSSDAKLASGKVEIQDGVYIEIITINKFTPGKCDSIGPNFLLVSFEEGDDKSIKFKSEGNAHPYSISLDSCKKVGSDKPFGMPGSSNYINNCSIFYDGNYYRAKYENTPQLMIDKNQKTTTSVSKRNAKGVIVE